MANYLQRTVRGYIDNPNVVTWYIRLEEAQKIFKETYPDMEDILPYTLKYVQKKYVRIGEGSIMYAIGRHRFIEMTRAAGAIYKINEGTGGMVLISLDIFDEYME